MRLAACTAVLASLAGCSEHGHSSPPTGPAIVVTRDHGTLPARCAVRRSALRVAAFIEAFNRGDATALDRTIADSKHFQWYSVNEQGGLHRRAFNATGPSSAVYDTAPRDDRPALLRYLASRSKAGERMHLVQVMVSRVRPRQWLPSIGDDVAGVQFEVTLDSPDLASFPGPNRLAAGKGGFSCSDGRLLVWSMGLDTTGGRKARAELLCRRASRVRLNARRVIACSR